MRTQARSLRNSQAMAGFALMRENLAREKEFRMNRPILVCALFVAATAVLGAQEASQANPYQGTSNPPPDDTIITSSTPQAKPPAGRVETESQARPTSVDPAANFPVDDSAPNTLVNPAANYPANPAVNYREAGGEIGRAHV